MKKFGFWVVLVLLAYSLIEGASFVGLLVLEQAKEIRFEPIPLALSEKHREVISEFMVSKQDYVAYSSTLGWTIQVDGRSPMYQANSAGVRGDREYSLEKSAGVRRITTFGDSYTHGDDVANNETWQFFMEELDPDLEVMNFGVGAYGFDQAYLRYLEDGQAYDSDIVLIGFLSENIMRDVNNFRPFLYPKTGAPLAKPRFEVADDKLELIENPVNSLAGYQTLLDDPETMLSELGENDFYFQHNYKSGPFDWSPTFRLWKVSSQKLYNLSIENIIVDREYNEASEAFIVTRKIFDEFHAASIKNGSTPVILVFPHRFNVIDYQKDELKQYAPLLAYFDSVGYEYIDLMDVFEEVDGEEMVGGHYSPEENEMVAAFILESLENLNQLDK